MTTIPSHADALPAWQVRGIWCFSYRDALAASRALGARPLQLIIRSPRVPVRAGRRARRPFSRPRRRTPRQTRGPDDADPDAHPDARAAARSLPRPAPRVTVTLDGGGNLITCHAGCAREGIFRTLGPWRDDLRDGDGRHVELFLGASL
jgi:hypothetical protein